LLHVLDLNLNFRSTQGEDDGVPEDVQEHGQEEHMDGDPAGNFEEKGLIQMMKHVTVT
jgi:hypothetical protein